VTRSRLAAIASSPARRAASRATARRSAASLRVTARHFVLSRGGIGTPAILLRSRAPDPHLVLGARTFLHPTVVSGATMPQKVAGFTGAPQTIYTDHFQDRRARRADGLQARGGARPSDPRGITLPGSVARTPSG
jgi:hypothetical protein